MHHLAEHLGRLLIAGLAVALAAYVFLTVYAVRCWLDERIRAREDAEEMAKLIKKEAK